MAEAGQRQLLASRTAPPGASAASSTVTDAAGLGETDGGGQAVRAAADDDRLGALTRIRSASWWSMLFARVVALAPERVLGVAAGDAVGLLEVPRHRVPRPGRRDPGPSVGVVEHEPLCPEPMKCPVGRQVEADDRRGALGHDARLVLAVARHARPRASSNHSPSASGSSGVTSCVIVTYPRV